MGFQIHDSGTVRQVAYGGSIAKPIIVRAALTACTSTAVKKGRKRMEFQIEYARTIRQVEDLVQTMFDRMSPSCKYCKIKQDAYSAGSRYNTCMYYDRGAQRCDREICPILEEG